MTALRPPVPSRIFQRANWNFIYGLSGKVGQSALKISQILWPFLLCLHYKKIIRNIVINLIIKKTKYISIYISRDQADETDFLQNKYSVVKKIFILKVRKKQILQNIIQFTEGYSTIQNTKRN